jgi:hypothetical protein
VRCFQHLPILTLVRITIDARILDSIKCSVAGFEERGSVGANTTFFLCWMLSPTLFLSYFFQSLKLSEILMS